MVQAKRIFPWLLLAVCAVALGWIVLAFYSAILWGVILALLLMPLYLRILHRVHGHQNTAAALALLVVVVMGVVPFVLITTALARQASDIYLLISAGTWKPAAFLRALFERFPDWLTALLTYLGIANGDELLSRADAALVQGSRWIATQTLGIGLSTFDFASSLCIALYLAFFLLRDGDHLSQSVWRTVPLHADQKAELRNRFTAVVRATIKGSLAIAALQGTLGGLAFYYLGVQGALLWSILMAVASLIPVVGTALVWLPVAVYFLLTGDAWKALQLTVYGVVVIGLIDNLVRPVLVGRGARLPDYVVMVTTLGGIAALGLNGFVIGPAIAAMFVAVWHICTAVEPMGEGTARPLPAASRPVPPTAPPPSEPHTL